MRVLITRPQEDAVKIAALLKARGLEPVVAPLLEVRFHHRPEISLDGVQAVLATSANGVRALAQRTNRRDVPIFAVGPQTEQEARSHGFASVRNAEGDARTLAVAAAEWTSPANGSLLHVKGAEADGALAALLEGRGFEVRSAVLYDVAPIAMPEDTRRLLTDGKIDAALFFSARSARVFAEDAITFDLANVIAACISHSTAAALSLLVFREIRVAEKPNQDALLACLS
jgi:uroporphyrinogen-III synthase